MRTNIKKVEKPISISHLYSKQIEEYTNRIESNPKDTQAYVERAQYRNWSKDWKGAFADYSKIVELNPNDTLSYYERAQIKSLYLADYMGALSDFTKAIELNRQYIDAYSGRSSTKVQLDRLDEALTDIDSALLLLNKQKLKSKYDSVNLSKAFFDRARIKSILKYYKDCISDCTKALKLDSGNVFINMYRGDAKSKTGDYTGAITDFNRTIEEGVGIFRASCYYERGLAKSNLGDYYGTIEDCKKAILLSPQYDEAYCLRGVQYNSLQKYKLALVDFNTAITINPKYGLAYFGRGLVKIALKQTEDGCLDLSKAGELGNLEAYQSIKELCQ